MLLEEKLKHLRKLRGLTQEDVAKKIGVNKSTIQRWENGRGTEQIKLPVLQALAKIYNVNAVDLIGNKANFAEINAIPYNEGKTVPIFGTVRAGVGGAAYQEILGYEPVDATYNNADDLFWLMVQGDSMTPELNDGDMVLVRKQTSVDSGDLAVVIVDKEEALVKRVYYDTDLIELHSKNPYYPVRRFVGDEVLDVCVVGLVLESKRKYVKI